MNPPARFAFASALVCLTGAPAPALAQSAAESATRWGLLGLWRVNCATPASRSETDIRYRVHEGRLYYDRDFGETRDSHLVAAAAIRADGSIEVLITFPTFAQTRQYALIKSGDGRVRAISNRDVDTNQYTIADGKFTSNGAATPWQNKCNR